MHMKKDILLFIVLLFLGMDHALCQNSYQCFMNDKNNTLQISVCVDKNDNPLYVKYKGQDETIPLFLLKTKRVLNAPDGNPKYYYFRTYREVYRGKTTGTYVFTNAGLGGVDVTYHRNRDKKEFYFILISDSGGDKPCF